MSLRKKIHDFWTRFFYIFKIFLKICSVSVKISWRPSNEIHNSCPGRCYSEHFLKVQNFFVCFPKNSGKKKKALTKVQKNIPSLTRESRWLGSISMLFFRYVFKKKIHHFRAGIVIFFTKNPFRKNRIFCQEVLGKNHLVIVKIFLKNPAFKSRGFRRIFTIFVQEVFVVFCMSSKNPTGIFFWKFLPETLFKKYDFWPGVPWKTFIQSLLKYS